MTTLAVLLALVAGQDAPKTGGPFAVQVAKPQTTYWCSVPDDYTPDRSWPVMMLLHGAGDTAENFVKFWHGGGMQAKFILAAAKSRGQAWDDSDGDVILAVLEDVRTRYNVDPERTLLTGYSSGGFMATRWGFRHPLPWRVITAIAGAEPGAGKDYKASIGRMSVLIECGTRDPNLGICKNVFEKVQKDGFDCDSNWIEGMEHSPMKPEAATWVYEQILKRLNAPEERLKRGRKAIAAKRFGDAISELKELGGDGVDDKIAKSAGTELAKLQKKAADLLATARKKIEKGDKKGAAKTLRELLPYTGLLEADEGKKLLEELGPQDPRRR